MSTMARTQMGQNYWWTLLVRGIVAILFGLAALFWPRLALLVLVALFGAFALINGISALVMAIQERRTLPNWWILLVEGVVGILAGLITFFWPGITALALLYLIAIWAIFIGILEVAAAFAFGRDITGEWALGIAGILAILLGILLILQPPATGLFAMIRVIALFALLYGIMMVIRAFQVRDRAPVPATSTTPNMPGRTYNRDQPV
ncbi:MAG: HdeD family acid-resistance protein [Ktedonobacteraceae bacterium]|nr:HdeD family acid-resistance protein [Ktedonobacteraceae bacterium]MBO0794138.1 HdeD family acid-resistance protein [Ktedonobacteraceae bacterium]